MTKILPAKKPLVIVEDDPDDQFFLMSTFQRLGFDQYVLCMYTGEQLFKHLEEAIRMDNCPSIILLDYNIPVMNGEEILTVLKKNPQYNPINVMIYTTAISPSLNKRLLELGASDCYTKPVSSTGIMEFAQFLKQKIEEETIAK